MEIELFDMFWNEDLKKIFFCGDSFYGYWTIGEFEEFIEGLQERLKEIKNENHN